MKYVRLIARPDTWYKAGSEVFHEDYHPNLMPLEVWENCIQDDGILCYGIRVCEDNPNERGNGWPPGFERMDGEWCMIEEFEVEVIDVIS